VIWHYGGFIAMELIRVAKQTINNCLLVWGRVFGLPFLESIKKYMEKSLKMREYLLLIPFD
jgi:hypothetical protein